MFKDKEFLKKLLTIGIPIAIQNLIMSSMNIVDVFMVGQLGEVEIAGLGLANQIFFLMILILFGINSGGSIFIAQFWGKKNIPKIRQTVGISIVLGVIVTLFSFVGVELFSKGLMGIYTKDINVIARGSEYLVIVAWSYVFTAVGFSFAIALRSIGNTKVPMYTSLISLVINLILNYIFIFGKLGFPAMGVKGAALATVIARIIECIAMIVITYSQKYEIAGKLKEFFSFEKEMLSRFVKISLPVIFHESFWALGVTTYNVVYARIGTSSIAAVSIEGSIERLAFVLFVGIGNAASVMIGNKIGEDKEEEAYDYAIKFAKIGPLLAIFMGIFLAIISSSILKMYNVSEEVYTYSKILLIMFAGYMPFKVFNMINIVGILRSGGDTKAGLFLELSGIWLIGVPLALFTGFVMHWSVYYVYFFANTEEIFKAILGIKRLLSKKWLKNLVSDM